MVLGRLQGPGGDVGVGVGTGAHQGGRKVNKLDVVAPILPLRTGLADIVRVLVPGVESLVTPHTWRLSKPELSTSMGDRNERNGPDRATHLAMVAPLTIPPETVDVSVSPGN